jgi:integrase
MKLTEKAVRALQPPAPNGTHSVCVIHRDSEQRGFGLRVSDRGAKSFIVEYSIDAVQRRMTLGVWPELSCDEARRRAREIRSGSYLGEDPLAQREERRQEPSFGYLVDQYWQRHVIKEKLRSAKTIGYYLQRDLAPWRSRKASDISARDIIALCEAKAVETPGAANMLQAMISAVYSWAISKHEFSGVNPGAGLPPAAPKNPRSRFLSETEIRIFWERLDSAPMSDDSKLALKLLLITGKRAGEVLGMKRSEIDLQTSWWLIPSTRAKNKKTSGVFLTPLALQLLGDRLQEGQGEFVFASRYRDSVSPHLMVPSLSNAFRASLSHLGLSASATPHDLRRTITSHLGRIKVQPHIKQLILNHRPKDVTSQHYDWYDYEPELRQAWSDWSAELQRIISGRTSKVVTLAG